MNEYSQDDVVYIAVVRSRAPKDGREVKVMMEAFREAGVEPVTTPHVAAVPVREAGANHHAALVKLGFDFDAANRHFVVVADTVV